MKGLITKLRAVATNAANDLSPGEADTVGEAADALETLAGIANILGRDWYDEHDLDLCLAKIDWKNFRAVLSQ
jgi:hypothetical protein